MNSWYQIRRLRGPAILILIGVLALLDQWHILSFGKSWPLWLIFAGLMTFAERAAWAADHAAQAQQPPYPQPPYAQPIDPQSTAWTQAAPQQPGHPLDSESRR